MYSIRQSGSHSMRNGVREVREARLWSRAQVGEGRQRMHTGGSLGSGMQARESHPVSERKSLSVLAQLSGSTGTLRIAMPRLLNSENLTERLSSVCWGSLRPGGVLELDLAPVEHLERSAFTIIDLVRAIARKRSAQVHLLNPSSRIAGILDRHGILKRASIRYTGWLRGSTDWTKCVV